MSTIEVLTFRYVWGDAPGNSKEERKKCQPYICIVNCTLTAHGLPHRQRALGRKRQMKHSPRDVTRLSNPADPRSLGDTAD